MRSFLARLLFVLRWRFAAMVLLLLLAPALADASPPSAPTVAHFALLADAAPAIAPAAVKPAPLPDVSDVQGDVALAKELAGAAKAKNYLLLVSLFLLVAVGVVKKLAGKVKMLAAVDTHVGGLALNFVLACAAVLVGASRAGMGFSWGLLEIAAMAGLTAAGGWHAVVDPLLTALFPPKQSAPVAVK